MESSLLIKERIYSLLENLGVLILLLLLLPLNLLIITLALLGNLISKNQRSKIINENPKNILLTGAKMTKCLQLARFFDAAGHKVFMLDNHKYWLSGNQFSNSIAGFYTVPEPQKDWEGYSQGLLNIVKNENIDVFITVSAAIDTYYESLAKPILSPYCEVFHFDPNITEMLDNKFTFIEKAKSFGLSVPKSFLITDPEQVINFDFETDGSQYILKSIPYDSVRRLDRTKLPMNSQSEMEQFVKDLPISPDKPWIMQEFIKGKEYCTHSTVVAGKTRLYCCCESSEFQVNYQHIDMPEIYEWTDKFVQQLNITGQVSFDFIKTEDGRIYPIECNPRTHSAITTFHDHSGVAEAYLNDSQNNQQPIKPLPNSKPTYWTYHELWRLKNIKSWQQLKAWWQRITQGKDAILDVKDPLPFLMVHHWHFPLLLLDNLRKFKRLVGIDFNIGKLIE